MSDDYGLEPESARLLAARDLAESLVEVERAARAFVPWADPLPPEGVDHAVRLSRALELVDTIRARCDALRPGHYLVARTPGCTCHVIDAGRLSGPDPYPPEWEQNMNCPVHPGP